jgi:hypothetical protein
MKRIVSSLLVVSILALAIPAGAAESTPTGNANATPIRAAIAKAGTDLAQATPPSAAPVKAQVPRTMPRTGSDRIRKQGGGPGMMVFGLISTLVGVGATVYMVKQMKKDTPEEPK